MRMLRAQEAGAQIAWLNREIAIGGVGRPEDWPQVYSAGVRAVVDLCDEPGDLGAFVRRQGMRYLRLCVKDGATPGAEELHIVTSWLLERSAQEGPVLIQDGDRVNNDALVACAALIKTGLTYDLALQALARVRPEAALSYDQTGVLLRFAADLS
jgi:hypothetical protein